MRIVWRGVIDERCDAPERGVRATFAVVTTAEDATVGDLAVALGVGGADALVVDGRRFPSELPLAETAWCDGVDVGLPRPQATHAQPTAPGATDRVTGGVPAATLDPVRHASSAGLVPFNRPPRRVPDDRPGVVTVPAPAAEPPRLRLALATVVVPIVMAAVFVALTGSWTFAGLSAVAPVVAVVTWLSSNRRNRQAGRLAGSAYRADVERFRAEVLAEAARETDRRRRLAPGADVAVRWAGGAGLRLWERRSSDRDAWSVSLGSGDQPWCPPLEPRRSPVATPTVALTPGDDGAIADLLGDAATLLGAPVIPDLSGGAVVGVVGDLERARALARALVVQLTVHHGPADLAVAVVGTGAARAAWRWTAWLPHVRTDDQTVRLAWDDDASHLAVDVLEAAQLVAAKGPSPTPQVAAADLGPRLLVVVDGVELVAGRRAPVRELLRGVAGPVIGVVLAPDRDQLPATCTTLVELPSSGTEAATVHDLRSGAIQRCTPEHLDIDVAAEAARAMARFEDPERVGAGARLPACVGLWSLLGRGAERSDHAGGEPVDRRAAEIRRRWRAAAGVGLSPRSAGSSAVRPSTLRVPLGVGADGVVEVDLVHDGPHALVAGTTGSGKSELLRTWVVAMAACHSPDDLNVLLVDYKGGSAFDACARLPHVVGVVTDLDEHLAARALRCLHAELRVRERLFRLAGASDLDTYRHRRANAHAGRTPRDDDRGLLPLGRLVVVVDEFATLAADLPEFLDALVGVAQRGRSLGVHLVLATQRPHGAVNDNIRANTNLRIALRVTDRADSLDVVGDDTAAAFPPTRPGRTVFRRGPGTCTTMQTASTGGAVPAADRRPVELVAPTWSWTPPGREGDLGGWDLDGADLDGPDQPSARADVALDTADSPGTELDALVEAIRTAAEGAPPPRTPWLPPLPEDVDLETLEGTPGAACPDTHGGPDAATQRSPDLVPLWLADEPDEQRRVVGGWDPALGNLLVYGAVGSGTTTVLRSIALQLAARRSPADVHVYVVDGGGGLADIGRLPHVGAVVTLDDGERRERLLRRLTQELRHRRALPPEAVHVLPRIVLLVDGTRSLFAELDAEPLSGLSELLTRVLTDGPAVGITAVLTGDSATAVRHQLVAAAAQRLVLALADPTEARQLGVRHATGAQPGRGVDARSGLEVQVARVAGDAVEGFLTSVAQRWLGGAGSSGGPDRIGRLPQRVVGSDLPPARRSDVGVWELPVGIGAVDLEPTALRCHPGEHVLVAGPPRSGRTTVLAHLAQVTAAAGARVVVLERSDAIVRSCNGDGSPPRPGAVTTVSLDRLASLLDATPPPYPTVPLPMVPTVVVVDDIDSVEDHDGTLADVLRRPDVLVAGAGRADALRSAYGHWSKALRAGRVGVLLAPDLDLDGDLLGVRLPRRTPVAAAVGRGYVAVGGEVALVQLAVPTESRGTS